MLQLLQKTATASPNTTFEITKQVADEMRKWRALLRHNRAYAPAILPGQIDALWTDASTTTGAAIRVRKQEAFFQYMDFRTQIPIFCKELLAALMGTLQNGEGPMVLLTDNQPLAYVVANPRRTHNE